MEMPSFINISTYKFTPLKDLKSLRHELLEKCKSWNLKGTILLSTEGINLFVAGNKTEIELLLEQLKAIEGLKDLTPKISLSEHQPFTRMLVKIKKEIITFGVEGIDPAKQTSRKIAAKTLKKWLDEGKKITLFDTRNDYEVKLGTFKNAIPAKINHFKDFPKAVARLPESLKNEPIVMFCTGGIRCEKAGPFMEKQGFKDIYQLDGGILKYFEEVGGDHYDGECFVFDKRVGVDPNLQESDNTMCFLCLTPLTAEEQEDERYVAGKSCPNCFKTTEQEMRERIEKRQSKIYALTHPLPGKEHYNNIRPFNVPESCHKKSLLECVVETFPYTSREEWLARIDKHFITDEENKTVAASHIVKRGERYFHLIPETSEPDVNADIKIMYEDEAILVINKPAPLPVHPCGRYNRNTLQYILDKAYHPQRVHLAHRLDANTSGVIVLTRKRFFAGILQPQFERGEVEKVYLAKVIGHPKEDTFSLSEPISDLPGVIGSRIIEEGGREAHTDFKVLSRNDDGTSLLEVRPKTGRTNQIRVHLWSKGFPICGDQVYLPNKKLGGTQTIEVYDKPMELRSHKISFTHPLTKKWVSFEL